MDAGKDYGYEKGSEYKKVNRYRIHPFFQETIQTRGDDEDTKNEQDEKTAPDYFIDHVLELYEREYT